MIKDQMEKIYQDLSPEEIPWNIEAPPDILEEIVQTKRVEPCSMIDLGCGAGNYVIYFSEKGFTATGVDFSEAAIEMARRSAENKKVKCRFIAADLLGDMSEVPDTFDFAYDWEVLHHIFPEHREKYVSNVHKLLNPGGKYLSVCFSEQSSQFGGKGKYRETPLGTNLYFSSESELHSLFKRYFKIEELKTVDVTGKYSIHRAVYAFMKKI